jgi:hypothetical protein
MRVLARTDTANEISEILIDTSTTRSGSRPRPEVAEPHISSTVIAAKRQLGEQMPTRIGT